MNLHPIIHQALAGVMPASSRVDAYVKALQGFDWQFEWSDDHAYWRRQTDLLKFLRDEQRAIDADGALWRQHGNAAFMERLPPPVTP